MKNILIACVLLQAVGLAQAGNRAVSRGGEASVSGRVTPAPGAAGAALKALRVVLVPAGYPPAPREAVVDADGSFQFSNVPSGPYLVRLLTPAATSLQSDSLYPTQGIFVGDMDVTGIEFAGPHVFVGRLVVQGDNRSSAVIPQARIEARNAAAARVADRQGGRGASGARTVDSAPIGPDGGFVLCLPEGEHLITLMTFAAGASVRSMAYGAVDLMRESLNVSGAPTSEILVTITQPPGFSVRGRLNGLPPGTLPSGLNVNTPGASAPIGPDGSFELRGLPPGERAISLVRPGASILSGQTATSRLDTKTVTVTDKDLNGIMLDWKPLTPVSGRIVLLDKNGAVVPGAPPGAVLTLTSRDGKPIAGGCDYSGCRADILTLPAQPPNYDFLLPPGETDVRVDRLPAGYVMTSIASDGVDLSIAPLKIDAGRESVHIEATVQNTSGASLRGRVVTNTAAPRLPRKVTLRGVPTGGRGGAPVLPSVSAPVSANGSFEFAAIAPGTYELSTNPDGSPLAMGSQTSNITVGDRDVTDVPIIGISDTYLPSTLQSANEAAAFQNMSVIQRAENTYRSLMQRYGTIHELIEFGLLGPGFADVGSGYGLSATASETDFTITAIPTSLESGRYELYLSRMGGARYLRLTGEPATSPRRIENDGRSLVSADGLPLFQVAGCGGDVPLCLRFNNAIGGTQSDITGHLAIGLKEDSRLTPGDSPAAAPALPADVYVGLVSSIGFGNLTRVRPDGFFRVSAPPQTGEYRVTVQNLPAGYRVKSVTSRGIELVNGAIPTTGDTTPGALVVTLELKP